MKALSGLVLMVLLNGAAISQTSRSQSDSAVIANKDLWKAAVLIEQGKGCKAELSVLKKELVVMEERLQLKDSIIMEWGTKGGYYESLVTNYTAQMNNYQEQVRIAKSNIMQLEKSLKKQKAKTWIVAILSSAAITYLLVK